MNLELTDKEAAALLRELNGIIDGDRYFLSPRIRTFESDPSQDPTGARARALAATPEAICPAKGDCGKATPLGMTLQLTSDQVTRLALARYLLKNAETQFKNPQPLCSLSLLSMHDAVEMILDVVAEAANTSIAAGRDFASYWKVLKNGSDPVHLPLERQMIRLNQARVALKHHGQRPCLIALKCDILYDSLGSHTS
jgi:hypothetical protein